MAALSQILQYKYVNAQWSLSNEDYNTLVWYPENTVAKPTLATLQGFSAEVDGLIATDERDARRRDNVLAGGQLLTALSAIVDALADIQTKLRTTALTSALNTTLTAQITTVKNRI